MSYYRPNENLIGGLLDNRERKRVTGWLLFCRHGQAPLAVTLDLDGDFSGELKGRVLMLSNPEPSEKNQILKKPGSYMGGFSSIQQGEFGDIGVSVPFGPWSEAIAERIEKRELTLQEVEKGPMTLRLSAMFPGRMPEEQLFESSTPFFHVDWFAEGTGRVVLELDPTQVQILSKNDPRMLTLRGFLGVGHKLATEVFARLWKKITSE